MSVADMCKAIVELSDNTCANLLLARVGGPAALTDSGAGQATRSRASTTTSRNSIARRRAIPMTRRRHQRWREICAASCSATVLSPASREHLTDWMVDCKTGDNRLRGGLPADWKIGDKTGNNGKDASGDIAIAWPKSGGPVLICAYTQGGSPTPQQLEAVFKEIGAMVGRAAWLAAEAYAGTRPPKNGISARLSVCGRFEVKIISAPA